MTNVPGVIASLWQRRRLALRTGVEHHGVNPGHAEIAGAGFGGLVAAIALAERGWTVRVNERRPSLAGEGYGIAIHNNMARIFASFDILDQVLAGGMRIDRRDSLDRDGRVVMTRKTARSPRSEEHTSELQSPYVISYAVF